MDQHQSPIDTLFETFAATYGSAWGRSIGAAPIDQVKAVWRKHLTGFVAGDIKYAIEHLPSKCPNVLEFRDLCRAAPKVEHLKVTHQPSQDPEKVAEVVGMVKAKLAKVPPKDPKQWARNIVAKFKSGKTVSPTTLRIAQEALGSEGRMA